MSFEKRRRVVLTLPWRRGCAVPLCNPVVLHWGLNCLGDIFGCPSWGGRCAAGTSREGAGMLNECPAVHRMPPPRRTGQKVSRAGWGASMQMGGLGGAAGCVLTCRRGRGGLMGVAEQSVTERSLVSSACPPVLVQWPGTAPRICPCHCSAGNLTSWTWPAPCVCVRVEVYTYVYMYLQIIYMLYWTNAYYKTN